MGLAAFDPDSSAHRIQERGREPPIVQVGDAQEMARAVADLLQNNHLAHTFGVQGEWEVRTTFLANRQAWRYQSSVFVHGKEARKGFPPIYVEATPQIRQKEAVTEERLAAFAGEAVQVHFAQCAAVAEYIVMLSILSQPLPRHRGMKKVALVLLSVAALLTASWWWRASTSLDPEQPNRKPLFHSIRWQTQQVSYDYPAGESFVFPLPALVRVPEAMPVEVTLEASGDEPSWLQLDRERLHIRGTAPLTAEGQTYRLVVRAHAAQGRDSRLLVWLTIRGQPDQISSPPPLPGHWTW